MTTLGVLRVVQSVAAGPLRPNAGFETVIYDDLSDIQVRLLVPTDDYHQPDSAGTEGATSMTTIRALIHDRRIEVPAPDDLPDGTQIVLSIDKQVLDEDGPMSPEEIARVHAAMQKLLPLEIPDEVADDLAAWERKLNQHGID